LALFDFPYPESDRRQSEGRFGGKRAAKNQALSAAGNMTLLHEHDGEQ
jgi:hypothetical protein